MNSNSKFSIIALVLVLVSSFGGAIGGVAAANQSSGVDTTRTAKLDVTQVYHVEEPVDRVKTNGTMQYRTRGPMVWLQPANFDSQDVTKAFVKEDAASIKWNAQRQSWQLNPHGTDGTYTVVFKASVPASSIGPGSGANTTATNQTATNATQTGGQRGEVTITYTAEVRVTNTNLVHVPQSEYQSTQAKAQNWTQHVVEPLEGYVQDSSKVVSVVKNRAIPWAQFTLDPTAAFRGSLLTLLVTFFLTAGGLFWLAVFSGIPIVLWAIERARRNRLKHKMPDVEDIERAKAIINKEMSKVALAQEDYTDGPDLPEKYARVLRNHVGDNVQTGLERIGAAFSSAHVKQVFLGGLIADDETYTLNVERSDDGDVESVDVVRGDGGGVSVSDASPEVYEALEVEDLPESPLRKGVDIDRLPAVPGSDCETLEEVIEYHSQNAGDGVDVERHFSEDLSRYAEQVGEVVKYAVSTDYVDDDGAVSPVRRVLNLLYLLAETGAEEHQRNYRQLQLVLMHAAEQIDAETRTEQYIDQRRRGGLDSGANETTRDEAPEWEYDSGLTTDN